MSPESTQANPYASEGAPEEFLLQVDFEYALEDDDIPAARKVLRSLKNLIDPIEYAQFNEALDFIEEEDAYSAFYSLVLAEASKQNFLAGSLWSYLGGWLEEEEDYEHAVYALERCRWKAEDYFRLAGEVENFQVDDPEGWFAQIALQGLKEDLKKSPKDARSHLLMAYFLSQQEGEGVKKHLLEAVVSEPDNQLTWEFALSLCEEEYWDFASKDFDQLISKLYEISEEFPKKAHWWLFKARIHDLCEEEDQAYDAYQQAHLLTPKDPKVIEAYWQWMVEDDYDSEAIRYLEKHIPFLKRLSYQIDGYEQLIEMVEATTKNSTKIAKFEKELSGAEEIFEGYEEWFEESLEEDPEDMVLYRGFLHLLEENDEMTSLMELLFEECQELDNPQELQLNCSRMLSFDAQLEEEAEEYFEWDRMIEFLQELSKGEGRARRKIEFAEVLVSVYATFNDEEADEQDREDYPWSDYFEYVVREFKTTTDSEYQEALFGHLLDTYQKEMGYSEEDAHDVVSRMLPNAAKKKSLNSEDNSSSEEETSIQEAQEASEESVEEESDTSSKQEAAQESEKEATESKKSDSSVQFAIKSPPKQTGKSSANTGSQTPSNATEKKTVPIGLYILFVIYLACCGAFLWYFAG